MGLKYMKALCICILLCVMQCTMKVHATESSLSYGEFPSYEESIYNELLSNEDREKVLLNDMNSADIVTIDPLADDVIGGSLPHKTGISWYEFQVKQDSIFKIKETLGRTRFCLFKQDGASWISLGRRLRNALWSETKYRIAIYYYDGSDYEISFEQGELISVHAKDACEIGLDTTVSCTISSPEEPVWYKFNSGNNNFISVIPDDTFGYSRHIDLELYTNDSELEKNKLTTSDRHGVRFIKVKPNKDYYICVRNIPWDVYANIWEEYYAFKVHAIYQRAAKVKCNTEYESACYPFEGRFYKFKADKTGIVELTGDVLFYDYDVDRPMPTTEYSIGIKVYQKGSKSLDEYFCSGSSSHTLKTKKGKTYFIEVRHYSPEHADKLFYNFRLTYI